VVLCPAQSAYTESSVPPIVEERTSLPSSDGVGGAHKHGERKMA
jgi:hypothetical protein